MIMKIVKSLLFHVFIRNNDFYEVGLGNPFFFVFFFYTHCDTKYYFCVTSGAERVGAGRPICDPRGGSNRAMVTGDAPVRGGIDATAGMSARSAWSRGESAQMGVCRFLSSPGVEFHQGAGMTKGVVVDSWKRVVAE